MKKLFALLIASLFILFGCNSGSSDTIVVTGYAGDEWLAQAITEYNELGVSEYEFVWEPITDDYNSAVKTKIAGGEAPDIMYVDPQLLYELQGEGRLADLTDYIPESFFEPMLDGVVEAYMIDGTHYAIPYDFNTLSLYYNKEIFDQYGLEYPNETWTMDDFLTTCYELLEVLPEGVAPVTVKNASDRFRALALSYGIDFYADGTVTLTSPEVVTFMNGWFKLFDDGVFVTGADLGAGWEGEAFASGKAAMTIEGSWTISAINEIDPELDWDVTDIPSGTGDGEHHTEVYSMGLAITEDSEHKQECADFLLWLMTPEKQLERMNYALETSGGSNLLVYEEVNAPLVEMEPRYAQPIAAADYASSQMMGPNTATINQHLNSMAEARKAAPGTDVTDMLAETEAAINEEIAGLE